MNELKYFVITCLLIVSCSFLQAQNKKPAKTNSEDVFVSIEVMPSYPGGISAMKKHIADNFKYPELAKKYKIDGIVVVRFVVERDGSVNEVTILEGLFHEIDEEVKRVINLLQKFNPGTQNDRPVRVFYTLPITINYR